MTTLSALSDFAWNWILIAEGRRETHIANDHGGDTKFGLSQAANPELDIHTLTEAQARATYARKYWAPAACDALPEPVATAHFDAAVNHGVHEAAIQLQQALGVVEDGQIGPKTLAAVNALHPMELLVTLQGYRALYYHALVLHDPSQQKFLRGWFDRCFRLFVYLLTTQENPT